MDDREIRVHLTHCCKKHGCKYGQLDCPIAYGDEEQVYPCQDCCDGYDDDEEFCKHIDYLDEKREAEISGYIEQIVKERREIHEKERRAYWKGFITAVLVIILFHIGTAYVLLS